MVAALAAAASLACTPHAGLGTVTFTRAGRRHALDLATCRESVSRAPAPRPARVLVSPNGRLRARVVVSGHLQTIVVSGRRVRSWIAWRPGVRNGSPGPLMLLGWTGDSRWLLYAIDPQGSASLAADGVQLNAVALDGEVRRVAFALAYDDYRTWCGGRLVLTAGGDRIAAHGKRLVAARPPGFATRPLVRAPGRAWGSLTCAPGGGAVVVQSQPAGGVDESRVRDRWALWRVGLDGTLRRLTHPPAGFSDDSPRYAGGVLYLVRSRNGLGRLYALRRGRLVGPLAFLGRNDGYFGHRAWDYAVRP